MKKSRRNLLVLIILVALLAIPTGVVLAKELGMMTISGPGIDGEITVKGPIDMRKLEEAGFLEAGKIVKQPEGLSEGYLMKLFLNMEEGPQPWLQVTYYPDKAGGSGYINVVDLMNGAPNDSSGKWYEAAPQAETALRDLMTSVGISLNTTEETVKEGTSSARSQPAKEAADSSIVQPSSIQQVKQPSVSAAQSAPAQPEQVAPAVFIKAKTTPPPTPRMNPSLILVISAVLAMFLAFLSIRWLIAQQKIKALKLEK